MSATSFMRPPMQWLAVLAAMLWLSPAWCDDAISGTTEECIKEPVFEGKVCTLQANRAAGNGVILIHGLGGSVDDWKSVIPALAANFHVLTFDLPGFGKSDKGSQEYSPTRYARLAQYLADHYFPDKNYHIVGHSMGGAIALRFAGLHPPRFQRLALLDVAGVLHPQVISKFQAGSLIQRTSGVPQTRGFVERLSGRLLEQIDRLPISPIDVANSELGRDKVLFGGPEKIAALELAGEDFSTAINTITEPTLIVWGDNDMTVPLRTGRVLAARMQHARLEIIAGSGHVPMEDQPEKANTLLVEHLLASASELETRYPASTPLPALASKRVGKCLGESDMEFEGDYHSIELRDCSDVTIRNARVEQLKVINSRVTLLNTNIQGKKEGLDAYNSDITITNGDISGEIAIRSDRSRLDLAGVHLDGSKDAVKANHSNFVFSVSRAHSLHTDGNLHWYRKLNDEVL